MDRAQDFFVFSIQVVRARGFKPLSRYNKVLAGNAGLYCFCMVQEIFLTQEAAYARFNNFFIMKWLYLINVIN